jgi:hypothetical protein
MSIETGGPGPSELDQNARIESIAHPTDRLAEKQKQVY